MCASTALIARSTSDWSTSRDDLTFSTTAPATASWSGPAFLIACSTSELSTLNEPALAIRSNTASATDRPSGSVLTMCASTALIARSTSDWSTSRDDLTFSTTAPATASWSGPAFLIACSTSELSTLNEPALAIRSNTASATDRPSGSVLIFFKACSTSDWSALCSTCFNTCFISLSPCGTPRRSLIIASASARASLRASPISRRAAASS